MWYLAIVVAATIVLYYELYIGGAVSPTIIAGFGMTFPFYVYISVVGNAVGAFGSLAAGLSDRWGRANLVAYGLVITALLTLVRHTERPRQVDVRRSCSASSAWSKGSSSSPLRPWSGTSPRSSAGRRRWDSGLSAPSSAASWSPSSPATRVNHLGAWQDQFIICGIVGLVVGVVALFGLKELSPQLRDQLMVSIRDRALIEARARGLDVEDSLRQPVAADDAPGHHRVGVRDLGVPARLLHGGRLLHRVLHHAARLLAVEGQQHRRLVLGVRRGRPDRRSGSSPTGSGSASRSWWSARSAPS